MRYEVLKHTQYNTLTMTKQLTSHQVICLCMCTRCLCMCMSGALGWTCSVCSQTFSHNRVCCLSCAIRASDIGPQAPLAMSSLRIHVQLYCVPVSAVCADLPSTCNMNENVSYALRQQGRCVTFLFLCAVSLRMLFNGKFHLTRC